MFPTLNIPVVKEWVEFVFELKELGSYRQQCSRKTSSVLVDEFDL